jgi:hypothetical protein
VLYTDIEANKGKMLAESAALIDHPSQPEGAAPLSAVRLSREPADVCFAWDDLQQV